MKFSTVHFRFFFILVAVFFSGSVFATVESVAPLSVANCGWHNWQGGFGYGGTDQISACAAAQTAMGDHYFLAPYGRPSGTVCSYDSNSSTFALVTASCSGTNSCPVPSSGSAYTFNPANGMCERLAALPPAPNTCLPGSILNPATNMCQKIVTGCVTVTLADGTTSTGCDTVAPFVCPAGKKPGQANGIMMCAGGGPLPTAQSIAQKAALDAIATVAAASAAQAAGTAAADAVAAAGGSASDVSAARVQAAGAYAGYAAGVKAQADTNPNQTQAVLGSSLPSNSNGSWYVKTHPAGIQGVLTTNFNTLKATPLASLINNLVPTIGGTASTGCFTLSVWQQGGQQVCTPPGVLNFIGICIMLTALFSARSIIFGG